MMHKGFNRLRAWLMRVVLALPLTLTAPIAHADDFIDGWRAYSEGNYTKALSKWLTLAWVNGDEKAPEARHLVKQQMRLDFSLGDVAIKRAEKAARQCYDSNYQDCGQ